MSERMVHAGVVARIKAEGGTVAQYKRLCGYEPGEPWRGDVCGCPDDRCMGFHHSETEECGCFQTLLDDLAAQVEDARATQAEIEAFVSLLGENEREFLRELLLAGNQVEDELKGCCDGEEE